MDNIAKCASCGQRKALTDSPRIDGIKQPRLCKDCLKKELSGEVCSINQTYWILQMVELKDKASIALVDGFDKDK